MKPPHFSRVWIIVFALLLNIPASVAQSGTAKERSEDESYGLLVLAPRANLLRPLRTEGSIVMVSIAGSIGTIIEIGPIQFGLVDSHANGFAELVTFYPSGELHPLGLNVPVQQKLAVLPLLIVRIDRENSTVDLYADAQLIAGDIPVDFSRDRQRVNVVAGDDGARVQSIAQPDRNPLFEDTNDNGIDDAFERNRKSRLLLAAEVDDRKAFKKEWRDSQRREPSATKALHLESLKPGGG